MWTKIGNHPKEGVPLWLSDGDDIYSGFYGEMFFKRKYHAWGTNAHIKYWMYAPKPPNSQELVEVEKSASTNTDNQQCLCETCMNTQCDGMSPNGSFNVKYTVHDCNGYMQS